MLWIQAPWLKEILRPLVCRVAGFKAWASDRAATASESPAARAPPLRRSEGRLVAKSAVGKAMSVASRRCISLEYQRQTYGLAAPGPEGISEIGVVELKSLDAHWTQGQPSGKGHLVFGFEVVQTAA